VIGFLFRRFAAGLATLFAIAVLSFCFTRLAPGSPFSSERQLHPEIIKAYEEFYGLDKPLPVQFWRALKGYVRLDFGPSTMYRGRSVNEYIEPGFSKSIRLGLLGAGLAFLIGLPLGVFASSRQNRFGDHAAMTISTLGICVPNFLLGPLLVLLFGLTLKWLPVGLWPEDGSFKELSKLILPTITLAMVHIAYISRLGRAGMLDVMNKDYIRTARAKGLDEKAVYLKHGLKNGITPVISYAGPMVALILTGSIVVEKVFAIPGLGQHFVNGALNRDANMIMGCVLVYSALVITLNFLVDVAYGFLDPRVRVAS
jgi:oligopeptide transport system permease protein